MAITGTSLLFFSVYKYLHTFGYSLLLVRNSQVGYKSLTVNINVKLCSYVCVCVEHGLMMMARSGRIINRISSLSLRLMNVIKMFKG